MGGGKIYKHTVLPIVEFFSFQFSKIRYKRKHVRLLAGSKIRNCTFEGYNSVGANSMLNSCVVGIGSYVGANLIWSNIKVGRFCSLGSNIHIVTGQHPSSQFVSTHPSFFSKSVNAAGFTFTNEQLFEEQPRTEGDFYVEIGNDVWIGDNVTIMGGCKIGDGAILGTNTLVTKDILPYTINVGIPSRTIKKRFSDKEIEVLMNYKWWNKSFEWISSNVGRFTDIRTFIKHIC